MDKLICVGKNYLKHAQELGDAINEEPIFFIKPPSTLVEVKSEMVEVDWPKTGDLHHEVELVLRFGKKDGKWTFTHYSIGLDMTLRDLQMRLKKAGHPWERAKTFLNSCVIGPWIPIDSLDKVLNLPFSLTVNGQPRQLGRGNEMRWLPKDLLPDLQRSFPLREGDALYTGTPEGVGPLVDGDILEIRGGDIHYKVKCRRN